MINNKYSESLPLLRCVSDNSIIANNYEVEL